MNTLEQITSIPTPTEKFELLCDFTDSIEYVLQRKATEYKKAGKMDLAIACLKKSNEIMPFSPIAYGEKEYLRLPKYLRLAGLSVEADQEEKKILELLKIKKEENQNKILDNAKKVSIELNEIPLIYVPRESRLCGECAKYHDRLYAVNPDDTIVPPFSVFESYIKSKKCGCNLITFPFTLGISIMRGIGEKDPVKYSNRPFQDDRTEEEKTIYDSYIKQVELSQKDRSDYEWICNNLEDIAPKSFSGYKKMKNSNSENYKKIVSKALEKNYKI